MPLFANNTSAAIYGLEGLELLKQEKDFFRDIKPFGFILFKRNCDNPQQLRKLTDSLRDLTGSSQIPILIDQEGGRVARLQAPFWRKPPAAACFADIAKEDTEKAKRATFLNAQIIAAELLENGINVNCAPLADIPVPGSHDIIGDRAYGHTPQQVVMLAHEMARGLLEGGVIPILKHIPGHGRAKVDSHEALPVVDAPLDKLEKTDFVPFRELCELPLGMTAHIIYTALDNINVATISPKVISYIRQNIGFNGLLMSDDLSMKALGGSYRERAEATLKAGCDLILHCNGKMDEMQEVASGVSLMTPEALQRAERAWETLRKQAKVTMLSDMAEIKAELNSLLPQQSAVA